MSHAGPTMLAAFLASLVEGIEALTVVLAVGAVRGWRGALIGAGLGLASLLVMVAVLGPALTRIPLDVIQVVVGALLLLFGLRWLRKAALRQAGVIALRDETAAYARQTASLRVVPSVGAGWDRVAVLTAYQITMIEGIEVVFIVIALGAGGTGLLMPAALGAIAALILVSVLGALLHRPIANVPENTLKLVVGLLLTTFGTFWTAEGLGMAWPAGDVSLAGVLLTFVIATVLAVRLTATRAVGP